MRSFIEHVSRALSDAGENLVVDISPGEITDFGGIKSATPLVRVRPRETGAVAHVLAVARQHALVVTPCGTRHSTSGLALSHGGILLDMTLMNRIRALDPDGLVVEAGAGWGDVVSGALEVGFVPPVVTNSLRPTVAGTVSAGGVGIGSHLHGAQADVVTSLEVVTADGVVHVVGPTTESDLFDAARAGQGQVAVITEVKAPLVAAPAVVRTHRIEYDDFACFVRDLQEMSGNPAIFGLEGIVTSTMGGGRLECAIELAEDASLPSTTAHGRGCARVEDYGVRTTLDHLTRFEGALGSMTSPRASTVRPWCTVFVPAEGTEPVVRKVFELMRPEAVTNGVVVCPVRTPRGHAPLLRRAAEITFLVSSFPSVRRTHLAHQLEANAEVLAYATGYGGCRYAIDSTPAGGPNPSTTPWRERKRRYDPGGVFGPLPTG